MTARAQRRLGLFSRRPRDRDASRVGPHDGSFQEWSPPNRGGDPAGLSRLSGFSPGRLPSGGADAAPPNRPPVSVRRGERQRRFAGLLLGVRLIPRPHRDRRPGDPAGRPERRKAVDAPIRPGGQACGPSAGPHWEPDPRRRTVCRAVDLPSPGAHHPPCAPPQPRRPQDEPGDESNPPVPG